ncbi:SusC/RagA family TonB-linked outer membrane protein [Lentimicrobium sp. L6]|nr:SusC/RagA family TonB-linked outer membrane protein [Lentimicrobium sp. L6]
MLQKLGKWPILFLFLMIGMVSLSNAQQITVTGTITDSEDGTTLIGVSVIQKGTTQGTTTDFDGNYSITVEQGSTLVYSYIGYNEQEVVAAQSTIDIILAPKSELLDEVIIIGYGTQKKTDKTGAVSHVTAEELNQGALSDPIQGLQGKAAGVSITKKGGDPNGGFSIRIRGSSGFTASSSPLYVIDGVPGGDPTSIASEDIESYNILKDAASTAIYGSQGANGVIIITTKKGGKKNGILVSEVNFSTKYSISSVAKTEQVLDASQIRAYASENNIDFIDGGANTDWQDELYRTGNNTENNLSFAGGSENSYYRASINHNNWTGVMNGTEKERTTAKMNITHKGVEDRLTLNANLITSFENNDYENLNGFGKDAVIYQSLTRNPTDPVYNSSGGYDMTQRAFNYENPISVINNITNIRDAKSYLGSLKGDFEFFEGLTGTATLSYKRTDQEYTYFRPKGVYASADDGYGSRSYHTQDNKQLEAYLTYIKSINEVHNINFMAGYSWSEKTSKGFNAQARDPQSPYIGANNLGTFTDVVWGDVGSYRNPDDILIGFFGRAQYNYKGKYYLTGSLRRDGSSKFGKNNKWGWFPTASASWNMQEEDFLENVTWLDQLKLRASYGVSGNQDFSPGSSQVSYISSGLATNPENGNQVITFVAARNDNPDLKWERTAETNLGIDFAIFNSKINGSLEVYYKNTTDLLYPRSTSSEGSNLAAVTFDNAGNIENRGIELYLQAHVINKSNFSYKTSLTMAHNKSKWIELVSEGGTGDDGFQNGGYVSGRGAIGDGFYLIRNQQGHEVSEFYLPEIATIQNGQFIFRSKTGGYTDQMANAERKFVGSPNPDIELGWANYMTFFKNWTLDFSFRSMIGHQKYNATQMFMDAPFDLPELNAVEEALDWAEQGRVTTAVIATEYLEDASFVKLDYISLGYNFNTQNIKWISNLKLFAVVNNVFTLSKYSGADPEIYYNGLTYGWDQYNVYPNTRTITFGLTATF